MNKVFLAGRLASDPQQFVTSNGITQSRVSIACSDNWNRNESYFFPCVAWQSTANFINTYLKKGDPVVIDGKLIRRSYVSKEGKTVYIIEVVIETIRPFGSRPNGNSSQSYNSNYVKKDSNINQSNNSFGYDDSDVPIDFEVSKEAEANDTFEAELDDEIVDLDWMKDIKG